MSDFKCYAAGRVQIKNKTQLKTAACIVNIRGFTPVITEIAKTKAIDNVAIFLALVEIAPD